MLLILFIVKNQLEILNKLKNFQATADDDVVFVKPKPIDDKTKAVLATAYKLPPNPCILVCLDEF